MKIISDNIFVETRLDNFFTWLSNKTYKLTRNEIRSKTNEILFHDLTENVEAVIHGQNIVSYILFRSDFLVCNFVQLLFS